INYEGCFRTMQFPWRDTKFFGRPLKNLNYLRLNNNSFTGLCPQSLSNIEETEKQIFDAILEGKLDLESAPWPSISAAAKDLIRKMLAYEPKKRITASATLEHPWMKEVGETSDKPIDNAVLSRMKQFRAMNKTKKLALK
ncbi:hypothetical protein S83_046687, partial [Arachis hypogaea]